MRLPGLQGSVLVLFCAGVSVCELLGRIWPQSMARGGITSVYSTLDIVMGKCVSGFGFPA